MPRKKKISNTEIGRRLITILAYCKEFGVDPNYILCWKTIPDRKDGLTEERFMNILESYGKKLWNEISN